jgi:hypothetical protein
VGASSKCILAQQTLCKSSSLPNIHIDEILHGRKYLTFATGDTELRNSSHAVSRCSRHSKLEQRHFSFACRSACRVGRFQFWRRDPLVTCRQRVKMARVTSAQAPAFISCYPTRPLVLEFARLVVHGGERSASGPGLRANIYLHACRDQI